MCGLGGEEEAAKEHPTVYFVKRRSAKLPIDWHDRAH